MLSAGEHALDEGVHGEFTSVVTKTFTLLGAPMPWGSAEMTLLSLLLLLRLVGDPMVEPLDDDGLEKDDDEGEGC